jgi:hypothetical protein
VKIGDAPGTLGVSRAITSVIAAKGSPAYVARMPAALLRLVMLIALAFMSFGMTNAPAMAASGSGSASGHCDEHQKPADAPAKMDMHCATCAALPAAETIEVAELRPQAPILISAIHALSDTQPEIATPPPKLF